jgi:hypothetical protein
MPSTCSDRVDARHIRNSSKSICKAISVEIVVDDATPITDVQYRVGGSMTSSAVCEQGHIISDDVVDASSRTLTAASRSQQIWSPDIPSPRGGTTRERLVPPYCGPCGARVLTECPNCATPLSKIKYAAGEREPYAFCSGCGQPFPWATSEQKTSRMRYLLSLDPTLSDVDRNELVNAIQSLVLPNSPEAEAPKIRAIQLIKSKAPNAFRAAQPILISLVSSAIQKALGLG